PLRNRSLPLLAPPHEERADARRDAQVVHDDQNAPTGAPLSTIFPRISLTHEDPLGRGSWTRFFLRACDGPWGALFSVPIFRIGPSWSPLPSPHANSESGSLVRKKELAEKER